MRAKTRKLKEMQGTFRPTQPSLEGVEFEPMERSPAAPDGWPLDAQMIWREVCTWMKSVGYLCKAYVHVIEEYSWAMYRSQLAKRELLAAPKDKFWSKEFEVNTKIAQGLMTRLGLTPSDSYKLPPRNTDQSDNEDSLLN